MLALALATTSAVSSSSQISASSFGAAGPLEPFWSTQPLGPLIVPPTSSNATLNNSALQCATPPLGRCFFDRGDDDGWLQHVLPMWGGDFCLGKTCGKTLTLPFTRNLSAVRMLGGLADHDVAAGTFEPLPQWDLARRDPATGAVLNNWTRMDATLDPFVAAGITPSPLVLDNIPYAFVAPQNRFYGGFGLGSAPDNTTEFGVFVEALARHLVGRYGHAEVSRWRFRLGTEADGPRMGPRWTGPTGNDPVPMPVGDGTTRNFSRGLDQYLETYAAAAAAVKRVVPDAGFGPSNFAGIGAPEGPTEEAAAGLSQPVGAATPTPPTARHAPVATTPTAPVGSVQLDLFAKAVHARQLPIDFFAMSEYSRKGVDGTAAPQEMASGVSRIAQLARTATTGAPGVPGTRGAAIPLEVHEYGWAFWLGFADTSNWPHGSFGAAYNIASWLWQRTEGVGRVFHWGYKFDDSLAMANPAVAGATAQHAGRPLISGWGWTLGAMELLLGGDGAGTVAAELVVDTPSPVNPAYNTTFGAIRAAQPRTRTLHYLLCAFSGNFTDHSTETVRIDIGAADFPDGKPFWNLADLDAVAATERVFNSTTSAHDVLRADLEALGGYPAYLSDAEPSIDMVRKMATPKGLRLAAADGAKYLGLSDRSLSPSRFSGGLEVVDGKLWVSVRLQRPAVLLLSLAAVNLNLQHTRMHHSERGAQMKPHP